MGQREYVIPPSRVLYTQSGMGACVCSLTAANTNICESHGGESLCNIWTREESNRCSSGRRISDAPQTFAGGGPTSGFNNKQRAYTYALFCLDTPEREIRLPICAHLIKRRRRLLRVWVVFSIAAVCLILGRGPFRLPGERKWELLLSCLFLSACMPFLSPHIRWVCVNALAPHSLTSGVCSCVCVCREFNAPANTLCQKPGDLGRAHQTSLGAREICSLHLLNL
jgi:hypothetical protein